MNARKKHYRVIGLAQSKEQESDFKCIESDNRYQALMIFDKMIDDYADMKEYQVIIDELTDKYHRLVSTSFRR